MTAHPARLRALVVDDSAYNRQTITAMLEALPGVEVVGRAMNGKQALKLAFDLAPDLITLDLEMPEMDGFAFLRLLMKNRPTPVLVVSGYAQRENVFRALELGALDFLAKPTREISPDLKTIEHDLQRKVEVVRRLHAVRLHEHVRAMTSAPVPFEIPKDDEDDPPSGPPPRLAVAIAASTGGPPALQHLVSTLPHGLPVAILVAQHMPAGFTKAFARRLNRLSAWHVVEARDGDDLCANTVYIAPGSANLEVDATGTVRVVAPGPAYGVPTITPSGDHLFRSLAAHFGPRSCVVVLTGMGSDGRAGVIAAHAAGAHVIAEDPTTAVMPGMPYSVVETGLAHELVQVENLGSAISRFALKSSS